MRHANSKDYSRSVSLTYFNDKRDWFFEKQFGMFVHWGLYAINGWHEQEMLRLKIPRQDYEKLAALWNPESFDPKAWIDTAKSAEMEYLCFTTKHHDGFCLWNTKTTPFNTCNSPYRRDILENLANECAKQNFPLCLYYSIVDGHHPNYPNAGRSHEIQPQTGDTPNWDIYLDYLKSQIHELCTQYGTISGFWWDQNSTRYKDTSINDNIRLLQPSAVINNRGFDEGDFGTPERDYDKASDGAVSFGRPTEACQSIDSQSWGYRKEEAFFTDRFLISSLDNYRSRGTNYLLNVGPDAQGRIPEYSIGALSRIGDWYRANKEAFSRVTNASSITSNKDVRLTQRDNVLYVHLFKEPASSSVSLAPLKSIPKEAVILSSGEAVGTTLELTPNDKLDANQYLRLTKLPLNDHPKSVVVVKLVYSSADVIRL